MVAPTESVVSASASDQTPAAEAAAGASAPPRTVSSRKIRANRRNAQRSTGPRTPQGKARSSRNSTSHGIFCRDLVLPGEDQDLFIMTRESFLRALKPQDTAQLALVDGAVSARWRLNRCQHAEADVIVRRTARARKLVSQRLETLKRNLRCEDFSSVALAAQCRASETFRRHYQEFQELRACLAANGHPGHAVAALMQDRDDQPLERLSRYEHRLEQSFHRCLRDLHVLKQRAREYADEPESPFLGGPVMAQEQENDPGSDRGSDRGSNRGSGAPPERSSAATDSSREEAEEKQPMRDAQATEEAAEQPTEEKSPVQNEPTADAPAASAGPAGACADAADELPDPQEMAALRQLTERLDRCRPDTADHDEDGDDDAYDEWDVP